MYDKILVAYDGAHHSSRALEIGVEFAVQYDAKLFILTVIPEVIFPVLPEEGMGVGYPSIPVKGTRKDITEYSDRAEETYGKILNLVFEDIVEKHPDIEVEPKLSEGKPSSVIVKMAEAEDIDLIIMGCRGLDSVRCFFLGSTTREVAETCNRPIMIVKAEPEEV